MAFSLPETLESLHSQEPAQLVAYDNINIFYYFSNLVAPEAAWRYWQQCKIFWEAFTVVINEHQS